MAGYGGARPGSGRKRKAIKYAGAVATAEKTIVDHLPRLLEAHLKLALGQVLVDDLNPVTLEHQVYALPPSERALEYLTNRIMGKPVERHEIEAEVTGNVTVVAELDEETRARVRAALLAPAPAD
jgi:hypothetical protein